MKKADSTQTVHNTKLVDTREDTWSNTILYRLAEALHYPVQDNGLEVAEGKNVIRVNPDELLDQAVEAIKRANALGQSGRPAEPIDEVTP